LPARLGRALELRVLRTSLASRWLLRSLEVLEPRSLLYASSRYRLLLDFEEAPLRLLSFEEPVEERFPLSPEPVLFPVLFMPSLVCRKVKQL
jgi:hypothetical protein